MGRPENIREIASAAPHLKFLSYNGDDYCWVSQFRFSPTQITQDIVMGYVVRKKRPANVEVISQFDKLETFWLCLINFIYPSDETPWDDRETVSQQKCLLAARHFMAGNPNLCGVSFPLRSERVRGRYPCYIKLHCPAPNLKVSAYFTSFLGDCNLLFALAIRRQY